MYWEIFLSQLYEIGRILNYSTFSEYIINEKGILTFGGKKSPKNSIKIKNDLFSSFFENIFDFFGNIFEFL